MTTAGASRLTEAVATLTALVCAATAASCKEAPNGGEERPKAGVYRYTVRAEVVELPSAASREIMLRHEAIDDFRDADGKKVGMDAMAMPFAVGTGAALAGIKAGDKVEMRLLVDWGRRVLQVEKITRLPPDTALQFGPARRTAEPAADGGL
ncbi:MAG TPA: copper-binding protein [Anaeromyxobacteraceae bacterium]|nr:copper-binding protein [Anaeromyxobacteraceae bacterium]